MLAPPAHWKAIKLSVDFMNDAAASYQHRLVDGFMVLRSLSTTRNGERWIHVSVSHPDRLPTWKEISKVKDEFIGRDREAYQVLAAENDHVNVHSFCLHLWSPEDKSRRVANLRDLVNEVRL